MEEEFGEFARAFFASLKIGFSKQHPLYVRDRENPLDANRHLKVRFIIPDEFNVKVTAARVLTKWRTDSTSGHSFLEVTEVEQLQLDEKADPESGSCTVHAKAWTDKTRVEKKEQGEFPFWYEIAVGSTKLENEFLENESTRLGQKASWDAGEFSCEGNAAFYHMYAPAIEMARQLPQLGMFSDNSQTEKYTPKDLVYPTPPVAREPGNLFGNAVGWENEEDAL